jgi:hypothetical protein
MLIIIHNHIDHYKMIFGSEVGSLPFKYLGIPFHYSRFLNKERKPAKDRFERKLGCWIVNMLSYGDRLILINLVLTSLLMFLLSFFEITKGVRKEWTSIAHIFLVKYKS